jgi:hypothetical protein
MPLTFQVVKVWVMDWPPSRAGEKPAGSTV